MRNFFCIQQPKWDALKGQLSHQIDLAIEHAKRLAARLGDRRSPKRSRIVDASSRRQHPLKYIAVDANATLECNGCGVAIGSVAEMMRESAEEERRCIQCSVLLLPSMSVLGELDECGYLGWADDAMPSDSPPAAAQSSGMAAVGIGARGPSAHQTAWSESCLHFPSTLTGAYVTEPPRHPPSLDAPLGESNAAADQLVDPAVAFGASLLPGAPRRRLSSTSKRKSSIVRAPLATG